MDFDDLKSEHRRAILEMYADKHCRKQRPQGLLCQNAGYINSDVKQRPGLEILPSDLTWLTNNPGSNPTIFLNLSDGSTCELYTSISLPRPVIRTKSLAELRIHFTLHPQYFYSLLLSDASGRETTWIVVEEAPADNQPLDAMITQLLETP